MSGWIALALLFALALVLLRAWGIRGALLQMTAAALLFGAAGYAVQGRPALESSPRSREQAAAPIPLTTLRQAFFGHFTPAERWLVIAESYARRGDTLNAVKSVRRGLDFQPGSIQLWIGLGNALVDHAHAITPAAEVAYRRAVELAPDHPAPKFFYGLALARSGDREGALMLWNSALADAPADASWRPYVEDAIAALNPPRGEENQTGS